MTHRLTLSPRRARVLRWCERHIDVDTVAVWSPEDKQTLAALVADGLARPTGARYELTADGVTALNSTVREPVLADFPPGDPDL